MRKLLIAVLIAAALLTVSHVEDAITFDTITGLDLAREKIAAGVTIERVYYTDGFGFSTSEFETADPEEILCLWEAVQEIVLGERVYQDITDWYPQIIFYLSDETTFSIVFDAHWLEIGGMDHYELENAEHFWALTKTLVEKYMPCY